MAIEGVARCGKFSSDRTIDEYCKEIWDIEPVSVPHPSKDPKAHVRSFPNLLVQQ
jgi:starch phosphorylase